MVDVRKVGGWAAWFMAGTYIVGFAGLATVFNPGDTQGWDAVRRLGFLVERKALFQVWLAVIGVLGGAMLSVLTVGLHARVRGVGRPLMALATPFGHIWAGLVLASGMLGMVGLEAVAKQYATDAAQAGQAWRMIGVVQDGIGGGVEFVGGLWVLLVSLASWRSATLPRVVDSLGLLVGFAGLGSLIPSGGVLPAVFGLGQILWFMGVGSCLTRQAPPQQLRCAELL